MMFVSLTPSCCLWPMGGVGGVRWTDCNSDGTNNEHCVCRTDADVKSPSASMFPSARLFSSGTGCQQSINELAAASLLAC